MDPLVTIIIPCFNEEKFMVSLLENILIQDYPRERLEVLVIDGMSNDGTREIIEDYHERFPFIRLLLNEKRFVPFALNAGIEEAGGDVIIRMDAHSGYPPGYVSTLVRTLEQTGGDNVGGSWNTQPANGSVMANAIAAATSSGFGVGNSMYRLGVSGIRKVDTVPYGCFHKSIFDRIGKFDEELLRNQDDEFNGRIIKNGGSIYLVPEVSVTYYARPDIRSLVRMFYQYSFFKPLVNRKLGKPATLRQFAPPLFILFIFFGWIGYFIHPLVGIGYLAMLLVYLVTDLAVSARTSFKRGRISMIFILPWLFPLIHGVYGIGYIAGFLNFIILGRSTHQISPSR